MGFLFVQAGRLAIGVSGVLEAIQHLYFIATLQEYAAVTPSLSFTFHDFGCPEFEVQLAIAEGLFGANIAFAGRYGHAAVFTDGPLGSSAVFNTDKLIEVYAVEQDDGIRWRFSGHTRSHCARFGFPHFGGFGIGDLGIQRQCGRKQGGNC